MMKKNVSIKNSSNMYNRIGYGAFCLVGIYFLAVEHTISQALIYFALALIFDPFNPSITWKDRPVAQRAWLICHLLILIILIGWLVYLH